MTRAAKLIHVLHMREQLHSEDGIVLDGNTAVLQRLGELLSDQLATLRTGPLQNLSRDEMELYKARDQQIKELLCRLPNGTSNQSPKVV